MSRCTDLAVHGRAYRPRIKTWGCGRLLISSITILYRKARQKFCFCYRKRQNMNDSENYCLDFNGFSCPLFYFVTLSPCAAMNSSGIFRTVSDGFLYDVKITERKGG